MPYVRSDEGRFMRRLEAGPSGWLAPTTAPRPGASLSPAWDREVHAVAASRVQIRTPNECSGPSRGTPGHPAGDHWAGRRVTRVRFRKPNSNRGLTVSRASQKRWVTMSAHRGFRGASLKHRARNAGQTGGVASPHTTFRCREASEQRGSYGIRRSARPSFEGIGDQGLRRTRRRKEYGRISASTRVLAQACTSAKPSRTRRPRVGRNTVHIRAN
jgi:hypothetical protein